MLKNILFYVVFILIVVLLWMAVIFFFAFNKLEIAYWPFIVLIVFVYPAIYKALKSVFKKY